MLESKLERPSLCSIMSGEALASSDRHCVSTISVRSSRSNNCEVVLVKYGCESEVTPAPGAVVQ